MSLGYEYPDDPYILAGSCGLEYTLISESQGYNNGYNDNYGSSYGGSYDNYGYR